MNWADCVLMLVGSVVELACHCVLAAYPPEAPKSRSNTWKSDARNAKCDSDNWKCPDSAEIARVLGIRTESSDRDCGPITGPCDFLNSQNYGNELASRRQGADPLWDRELDG